MAGPSKKPKCEITFKESDSDDDLSGYMALYNNVPVSDEKLKIEISEENVPLTSENVFDEKLKIDISEENVQLTSENIIAALDSDLKQTELLLAAQPESFTRQIIMSSSDSDDQEEEQVNTCSDKEGESVFEIKNKSDFLVRPINDLPYDYFHFFFSEQFLTTLCDNTNLEARTFKSNWQNLTVPELKMFIGLAFYMGIMPLQNFGDYWKKDSLFCNALFTQYMTLGRFKNILKYLNFSDQILKEENKQSSIIDYFNKKMDEIYYPGNELCMEDPLAVLMPNNGHIDYMDYAYYYFQQRVHHPAIIMLTEPDGMVLNVKKMQGPYENIDYVSIIFEMMQRFAGNNHVLYVGPIYASFKLFQQLREIDVLCTGILNKYVSDTPAEIKAEERQNFSCVYDGILVGPWVDPSKMFMLLSTASQIYTCPTKNSHILYRYHGNMTSHVRRSQLLSYYPCGNIGLAWTTKLTMHILHLMFLNSYHMFVKCTPSNMSYQEYRLFIIRNLLGKQFEEKAGPPSPSPVMMPSPPVTGQWHRLEAIGKTKNNRAVRRQCHYCAAKRKRQDTSWFCATCVNTPRLCLPCFNEYHERIIAVSEYSFVTKLENS